MGFCDLTGWRTQQPASTPGSLFSTTGKAKQERVGIEVIRWQLIVFFSNPRYVEKEHLQYCTPSELSSGLAGLPLDFIYINGTKTNRTTTKTLPTGEKLDGKGTYVKLMQYFTTTEKTPDEIYELGWSIINRNYPEVRMQFCHTERHSGFSVLGVKLQITLLKKWSLCLRIIVFVKHWSASLLRRGLFRAAVLLCP